MEKEIEIDGLRARYLVEGPGPDMILMHGWGCNASTLASVAAVASATHTVYSVDFPGFGGSEEPREVWGVELYTQWLEKFIKAAGIKSPILLGHSFGGRVGILYSSRHDDVDRLVLVDAAGIKPKRTFRYYYKVYTYKLGRKMWELVLGKEKARKRIDAMRAKKGSSDYNDASPMMRRILSKVVNEDLRDRLPLIKAPTLLVWGENDTATPISDARIMEKEIPDAGLVSFPGCGHYSFLDNPYLFKAVLKSFINR